MAAITYKCPNCGGGLIFNPQQQEFKCDYCLSEFSQADLDSLMPDLSTEGEQSVQEPPAFEAALYSCPSCGAQIMTDDTTAATFCYYCHNPVVLSSRLSGEQQPDFVIPFAIDRKRAEEMFDGWIRKKKYVPGDFYGRDQIEKLSGVYFPYWLYSCKVDGKLAGQGSRIKQWNSGNICYTETSKYRIDRAGSMDVDHVTRNALKKACGRLAEGVLPFQMEDLREFSMPYLSGFMAENRDIGFRELSQNIEKEIRDYAEGVLKSSLSEYSQITIQNEETQILNSRWECALVPVWTLTYKSPKDGKVYYFALNGQTGKICGELPVSRGRLAALFFKIFMPAAAVFLAVAYII